MKPIILNPNEIDYSVIDQMFSAMLSQNESKATIDALRPKVEAAVKELIRQRGLPKDFTGTIEYNGIKIVVRRPTSYSNCSTPTPTRSSTASPSPSRSRLVRGALPPSKAQSVFCSLWYSAAPVSCARGFQPRVRDSINRPSLGDLKRKKNQKRKIK